MGDRVRARVERDGDRYKVVNNLGEYFFEIESDPDTGVIDMYAGAEPDAMEDELFEAQHESLRREFRNIERVFAG